MSAAAPKKAKLSAAAKKRKYGGGISVSSRLELHATCVIATCDKGREQQACRQLVTWMNTYVERLYPQPTQAAQAHAQEQEETKRNHVEPTIVDMDHVDEDYDDDHDDEEEQDVDDDSPEHENKGSTHDADDFGDSAGSDSPPRKRARVISASGAPEPPTHDHDDDRPSSISSALAAELAALKEEEKAHANTNQNKHKHNQSSTHNKQKQKQPKARLQAVETKMKGLILVYIRDSVIQLLPLLTHMLTDVRINKQLSSTYITRLEPVQKTCFAGLEELSHLCAQMLPASFAAISSTITDQSYAIVLERRGHHDTMDRNKVIQTIAQHVPSPWHVRLSSPPPSVVIVATVLNRIAGLAVVSNYYDLAKYNVRALYETACGVTKQQQGKGKGKQKGRGTGTGSTQEQTNTNPTETETSNVETMTSSTPTSVSLSTSVSTCTSSGSASTLSAVT